MGIVRRLLGREPQTCPGCGKPFSKRYPNGKELSCSYCGRRLRIEKNGRSITIIGDPCGADQQHEAGSVASDCVAATGVASSHVSVATVVVSSMNTQRMLKKIRMKELCKAVQSTLALNAGDIVIVFPGGWFDAGTGKAESLYEWMERGICPLLATRKESVVVCCGVDAYREQMGVAIGKSGIVALARKFKAAPKEQHIDWILAKDYLADEKGKSRIFDVGGKRFYLSVCYDDFGIIKDDLPIPNGGIDAILSLVHFFTSRTSKEGGSGEAYYAKYGFSRASKAWSCRLFGAAVFLRPKIPPNWPSGVRWAGEELPTKKSKYEDFRLIPNQELKEVRLGPGVVANIRMYRM